MAKGDTFDDIGKPGKPPKKGRRFPWRLWLYAIVMTAGAGAGGFYTYQFRKADKQDAADLAECREKSKDRDNLKKQLDTCASKLGDETKRADGYAALNTSMTKDAQTKAADPGGAPHADAQTLAVIDDIQKQLAKSIEAKKLTASARRGEFTLTFPADGLFAAGTADLTDAGKVAVLEVGFTLKRQADRRFQVTGHTDDKVVAAFKDSWELSAQRALTVTRALIQAGVDAKALIAAGAGDADPVADKTKTARIEIALLPTAGELPALPATLGADSAAAKPAAPAPAPAAPAPAKP